jgi:hypothetical protein
MSTVPEPGENEIPQPAPDNPPADPSATETPGRTVPHVDDPMGDYDPEGESPHW